MPSSQCAAHCGIITFNKNVNRRLYLFKVYLSLSGLKLADGLARRPTDWLATLCLHTNKTERGNKQTNNKNILTLCRKTQIYKTFQ